MLFSLEVGQPVQTGGISGVDLVGIIAKEAKEAGLGDWNLISWGNGKLSNWVARVDGMTEAQIERMKDNSSGGSLARRTFRYNPMEYWRARPKDFEETRAHAFYVRKRGRHTLYGWERMKIGEVKPYRGSTQRLREAIGAAMVRRDLYWTFEITRTPELDDPVRKWLIGWRVERVS